MFTYLLNTKRDLFEWFNYFYQIFQKFDKTKKILDLEIFNAVYCDNSTCNSIWYTKRLERVVLSQK